MITQSLFFLIMLKDEVLRLKKEKDVVILAHNYQIPEVQDVADFVGDSLGLSRQAAKVKQKTILFCGVHFMAETAAIVSPDKRVLIPDLEAGCSLSDSITVDQLRKWKKEHPDAISVGYVNTTAEIKSELDYCCTSSNAVNVVNAIPKEKEILFLPDMFWVLMWQKLLVERTCRFGLENAMFMLELPLIMLKKNWQN